MGTRNDSPTVLRGRLGSLPTTKRGPPLRRSPYLARCVIGTVLRELLDHTFEIRIAGAKAPCEPVPTALGNLLAVRDHLELTVLPGVRTASTPRRVLMRVTRLATLTLLFSHVGQ